MADTVGKNRQTIRMRLPKRFRVMQMSTIELKTPLPEGDAEGHPGRRAGGGCARRGSDASPRARCLQAGPFCILLAAPGYLY